MNNPTLSVVMPALNEENNIEKAVISTIQACNYFDIQLEIIIVNDGSSDNTKNIATSLASTHQNIKLINHTTPQGIGYSFWDGVKHASNEVVVMFPGDNENNPADALSFLYLMNNVDIIIPFIHNVDLRDRFRRIVSSTFRFIINISFGINLNYTNGTVFYRKIILNDIKLSSFGFLYQAELLIKLIRKGYLFAEVPNFLLTRTNGKSKAISFKSLKCVIDGYLRLVYDIHIKRIENKDHTKLMQESISYKKIYGQIGDEGIND